MNLKMPLSTNKLSAQYEKNVARALINYLAVLFPRTKLTN